MSRASLGGYMRPNVISRHKTVNISEWKDGTVAGSSCEQNDPGSFGLSCSSWTWRFGALQHSSGCCSCCCDSGQQQKLLFVPRETHHAEAERQAGLVPAAGRRWKRWTHKNVSLMDPAANWQNETDIYKWWLIIAVIIAGEHKKQKNSSLLRRFSGVLSWLSSAFVLWFQN